MYTYIRLYNSVYRLLIGLSVSYGQLSLSLRLQYSIRNLIYFVNYQDVSKQYMNLARIILAFYYQNPPWSSIQSAE
ncbi:unnamed protein product [Rhizophagus irregularis]|nr:unnamed protein product [Rhizophagus irregularis]